jgi:hypothetical protein
MQKNTANNVNAVLFRVFFIPANDFTISRLDIIPAGHTCNISFTMPEYKRQIAHPLMAHAAW